MRFTTLMGNRTINLVFKMPPALWLSLVILSFGFAPLRMLSQHSTQSESAALFSHSDRQAHLDCVDHGVISQQNLFLEEVELKTEKEKEDHGGDNFLSFSQKIHQLACQIIGKHSAFASGYAFAGIPYYLLFQHWKIPASLLF